jgi:predicted dehydrogenase
VAGLDVIGAGRFAREMLLPHVKGRIALGAVVNATALSASNARDKFGFSRAETDAKKLWTPDGANAVLIATRHHLHADFVVQALRAGRHVFVEKPLCLSLEELAAIDGAVARGGSVMVGFNRRFAPATRELRERVGRIAGPKTVVYRVVPGRVDPQGWYANYQESGGRVLGEACHFFDWCCHVIGSAPARIFAQTTWPATGRLPLPDSVAAQVEFEDGSCAQVSYAAEAGTAFPKETITVFASGMTAEISNFQRLDVWDGRGSNDWKFDSKGHAEEMAAWLDFLAGRAAHPLPYAEARRSMLLTFAALQSIQAGVAVRVESA